MATSTTERPTTRPTTTAQRSPVFAALIGISALAVLLQGLWAGIFLEHDGQRDASESWIEVHARGGEVALLFAVLATLYALWKRRSRTDLWAGGLAFTVGLALEAYLGGLIVDDSKDTLTAVHVPIAMALMGLAVWLSVRATRGR